MRVARGIAELPLAEPASVATVGFFDGVHRGHQAVLARTVERAGERGVPSVAVTFDRHPREVLTPGAEPRLLTTMQRKIALIESAGIDVLVILAFTAAFSEISAEAFVRDVLVDGLHAEHSVLGANSTFGHHALGTVDTLPELGRPYGLSSEGVELLPLEGRTVSSSSIREALASGDLTWPTVALGRRFVLDGEVVSGHGRGTKLGFPTANLRTFPRLLLPGRGIYAGVAELDGGDLYRAAIDVGTNPTFGVEPLHVEAFLLEFEGEELRGAEISVEFWARLRDEERFEGVEPLVRAIAEDVRRTKELVPREALV